MNPEFITPTTSLTGLSHFELQSTYSNHPRARYPMSLCPQSLLKLLKLAILNLLTLLCPVIPQKPQQRLLSHIPNNLLIDPGVSPHSPCTPLLQPMHPSPGNHEYNKLSFQWQLSPDLWALPYFNNNKTCILKHCLPPCLP